jgi:hypothetical protein
LKNRYSINKKFKKINYKNLKANQKNLKQILGDSLFDIFEQKATEIASFDGENPIQNIFSKLVYLILFILLF